MKNKLSKIMGIGFALVLVASLLLFAVPASAGAYKNLSPTLPNMWQGFPPTPGAQGAWFFDPAITQVGPVAKAINGDIYAYVAGTAATPLNPGSNDIFKSTDGGHTWTVSTIPNYFADSTGAVTGPVVDMVCSSVSEDVLYVTDGNYVYKSINGGLSFVIIAEDSLELILWGQCGPSIVINWAPITCLDVGINSSGDSIVFIGVNATYSGDGTPDHTGQPSVLYINEAGYPSTWMDLSLHCFRADGATPGGYIPYSIGVAPNFAITKKIYVLVTVADDICASCPDYPGVVVDPRTYVIYNTGVACSWTVVDQLFWDCDSSTPNRFQINHGSRFAFPSTYESVGNLFIGVSGVTVGGDVYCVFDTVPNLVDGLDLNVQGYTSGCLGLAHANICSLDIDENDALIAGAWDGYQAVGTDNISTNVWYSTDGGWTWAPSLKDPTGVDRVYVIWHGNTALAGTRWCDCAFSMSCGDVVGQYWDQISLVNTNIVEVWDISHAPGYLDGSTIMYVLTYDPDSCVRSGSQASTSLWKWDGTYWERVFSSRNWEYHGLVSSAGMMEWVEVSPDFNFTGCVYLANSYFQMFRSTDQGCSWRVLAYPCAPLPTISAWIVVDEETVLAAGAGSNAGTIYKTTRHGTRPWTSAFAKTAPAGATTTADGVDFDLSPNIANDSSVLFSDDNGEVFLSTDLGATWAEIADGVCGFCSFGGQYNTYCVFDPGYGTAGDPGEHMIYAAAGSLVGRCALDLDAALMMQDWVYISVTAATSCDTFDLQLATGIDAAGDTALYVSDAGTASSGSYVLQASGTIGVRYTCDASSPYTDLCTCDLTLTPVTNNLTLISGTGTFQNGEPLNIISYNLVCDNTGNNGIVGTLTVQGFVSGAMGTVPIDLDECVTCEPEGTAVEILYANLTVTSSGVTAAEPTGVWRTLNPMDPMPPAFPFNTIEWEFLNGATYGAIRFQHRAIGLAGAFGVYTDDLWLTQASNMLWCLEDDGAPESPTYNIWMWDDPLAAPVIQVQPADGALLATTTTATLEWQPLDAATYYEVYIYSYCPTCPDNKVLFDNFTTNLTCIVVEGLTPGTTYYWKVRVDCNHPFVSKWSDLRSFDTALGAVPYLCAPWCGQDDVILTTNFAWDPVVGATSYEIQIVAASADGTADWTGATTYTSAENAFASIPALEYSTVYYWRVRSVKDGIYSAWAVCLFTTMDAPVEPPEAPPAVVVEQTEITPVWIWVIIGIGGALTIAVVILIVTTRKVP